MHEPVPQLMIKICPTRGGTALALKSGASINIDLFHQTLETADLYPRQGHMWRAMKVCLALFKQDAAKPQGKTAGLSFMAKAQAYHQQDARHVASAIYGRLLA